jgi:transposase
MRSKPHVRFGRRAGETHQQKRRQGAPARSHLGTKALEEVRRGLWQQMRHLPDPATARKFKGARWALLKNPEDLTDRQAETLTQIRRHGGAMWRGYKLN